MSLVEPVLFKDIPVNIQENRGQIAIGGKYIVQIGSVHGGIVNIAMPEQQPRLRPRPAPVWLRPRPFLDLLDRKEEIRISTSALQSAQPVEFCGEAGVGKTSLLRHLAHHLSTASYPDGVVFLSARRQPVADLLQSLFDAFYESDIPFKPTDAQMRHDLQGKKALVLLDDIDLPQAEVELLLDVALGCTFFLVTSERCLWGEGRTIALGGLPPDDALVLMERELGRPLTAAERPNALAICTALEGHPLRLLQAVSLVREEGRSLRQVARQVRQDIPAEALAAEVLASLSIPERRIVAILAAMEEVSLSTEHLASLANLPTPEPVLEILIQRGLVEVHDSRYKLAGVLDRTWLPAWDLTSLTEQALTYFTTWAEQHQQPPDRLLAEAGVIQHLLAWAIETGRWSEVLRLVRAVEGAFALNGRWDAWAQVLRGGLKAAEAMGDRMSKAWVLHQLGTRALCLGDISTAHTFLGRAIRLRETLGDQAGAAVTRHNIDLLLGPPPPVQTSSEPSPSPEGTTSSASAGSALVKGVAVLLPVALVTLGVWLWSIFTPPPPLMPSVRLDPTSLIFADQSVDTSSSAQTITLTNDGAAPLTISNVAFTGANPGDFQRVTDNCMGVGLNPGGYCTVGISFAPQTAGDCRASLIVTDNTADSPHSVPLSGLGIMPTPTPTPTGTSTPSPTYTPTPTPTDTPTPTPTPTDTPTLTPTPTDTPTPTPIPRPDLIAFLEPMGCVTCRQDTPTPTAYPTTEGSFTETEPDCEAPVRVVVRNQGDAAAEIFNISTLVNGFLADFIVEGQEYTGFPSTSGPLYPDQTMTLEGQIKFQLGADYQDRFVKLNAMADSCEGETVPGSYCRILESIEYNNESWPESVPLCETKPEITITPSAVDFGDQRLDKIGQPREVTIINSGTGTLEIGDAAISGTNSDEFHITSDECTGQPVGPNNSCTIQIIFAPTDTGPQSAALMIYSNDAAGRHSVPLNGTGVGIPIVSLYPKSLEFTVQDYDQPVTVTNTGSAPLEITNPTITGKDSGYFYIYDENCTKKSPIEPDSNCTISIRFTLTSGGPDELYQAELIIYDNALDSPQSVPLRGTGVGFPIIEISPERLEFYAYDTMEQTATIKNIGSAGLEIGDFMITGYDSDHFYIIEDKCAGLLIDPFDSCTLRIGFRKEAKKPDQVYEADLTIYYNDSLQKSFPDYLWGLGPPG